MKGLRILSLALATSLGSGLALASSYVGIGITIQKEDKHVLISDVKLDGPAARAGVRAGEILTSLDHKAVGDDIDMVSDVIQGGAPGQAVLLGLGAGDTAREVNVIRERIEQHCVIEGNVHLNFNGDERNGRIDGWIGHESIYWNVFMGHVSNARIGNESFSFDLRKFGSNWTLEGWVHSRHVSWTSYGSGSNVTFNEYENCIP